MQSFYISNQNNANLIDFEKFLIKHNQKVDTNFDINFYYRNEITSSFYKNKNTIYYNLGCLIYNNKFNKEGLESIHNTLSNKNLKDILVSDNLRGQFCLFIIENNNVSIITDKLGYYGVYLYKKGKRIALSNSIVALAKNNDVTLNKIGVAQYLSENYKYLTYACCDQNIFSEITYLKPGHIYNLNSDTLIGKNYFNLKDNLNIGKYNSIEEVSNLANETLKNNLMFLKDNSLTANCDLTGGVDTRTILSVLSNNSIKSDYSLQAISEYKDFSNYGKYSELKIVDKISKKLDFNINIYSEEKYNKNNELIEDLTFFLSNKQTYNRRAGYFFDLSSKNKYQINLSGMSGTEQLRLSYYEHFKNNNKLNLNELIKEYVECVDILDDNFIKPSAYYEHLNQFYSDNLSNITYDDASDLSSYIDYFAFYRTHFIRYHGLANSFLPFYTPFGDYNFAKLMYETSYRIKSRFEIQRNIISKNNKDIANINCTRGFPLSKITLKNFYKFYNILNADIPQQHFSIKEKFEEKLNHSLINFFLRNKKLQFLIRNKSNNNKKNLWNKSNDYSLVFFIEDFLSKDLPVYSIVNKQKLYNYVLKDCNYNVINRVINLNKLLEFL